jgi:RNA polymerase sigma-70 factor (ECF subfamily)
MPGDRHLVARLRAGDEGAFIDLVERYNGALLRLALSFVPSRAVAEEVVQETWLGVIQGIDRFEGRSSLRTWLFRILVNRAKTRGERERRTVPFSALADAEASSDEALVDADRFLPPDHVWAGHWAASPRSWAGAPEERLFAKETTRVITDVIESLPEGQRAVISLRDIAGWSSEDVCEELGISEVNQRVLLHRGRTKVRNALERHFEEGGVPL